MSKINFSGSPFRMIVGIYLGLTFIFSLLYVLPFSSENSPVAF